MSLGFCRAAWFKAASPGRVAGGVEAGDVAPGEAGPKRGAGANTFGAE